MLHLYLLSAAFLLFSLSGRRHGAIKTDKIIEVSKICILRVIKYGAGMLDKWQFGCYNSDGGMSMNYKKTVEGTFVRRINRFMAEVRIDGKAELVHVKNTGRCKELFIEGRKVYLEVSDNAKRKTRHSLISIYKGDMLVNIDSQVPNEVVYDALKDGLITGFEDLEELCRERTYKSSRFDIYYCRKCGKQGFIEIKGVTLEDEGKVMFPDAPTERGLKHIREMEDAVRNGYEGSIFFLIQMERAESFRANNLTDPKFAQALWEASHAGVNVLAYTSTVTKDSICIKDRLHNIVL